MIKYEKNASFSENKIMVVKPRARTPMFMRDSHAYYFLYNLLEKSSCNFFLPSL